MKTHLKEVGQSNANMRDHDTLKSHNPRLFRTYCVERAHVIRMVMKLRLVGSPIAYAFTIEPYTYDHTSYVGLAFE